jgi:hypothetical protein
MQHHTNYRQQRGPSPADAVLASDIARFNHALEQIAGRQGDAGEALLDALLDFFCCRCRGGAELQRLGARLFAALDRQVSCDITAGLFEERFSFHRRCDLLRITVDRQPLAELSLDSAIRLATLLHGAARANTGRVRVA